MKVDVTLFHLTLVSNVTPNLPQVIASHSRSMRLWMD